MLNNNWLIAASALAFAIGLSVPGAVLGLDAGATGEQSAQYHAVSAVDAGNSQSATARNGTDSQDSDKTAVLQEVVVNARRREENAQEVPIAVTVLAQTVLAENNVQTIQDLQYLVPSLSTSTATPNEARLSIRGQGASGGNGSPGVAVYLNEVLVPDIAAVQNIGPGLLFDLENVQVLKGPQGTLFGRNSVGGDILLQTARPTNEFGGRIQVSYGNYNDREVDGAVNIPVINDVLLTRIAINGQLRDGYTNVLGEPSHPNGVDADNRDSWSIRGTVTFHPVDWLQNDTIFTDSKYDSRGTYGVLAEVAPVGTAASFGFLPYLAQQQTLGVRTAIPISVDAVANGGSLSLGNITRATLSDNLTLRNIFGYHVENQTFAGDQDNTPLPFFDLYSTPFREEVHQITEELQLAGKSLAGDLDWVVGGYYLDQRVPDDYELATYTLLGTPLFLLNRSGEQSRAIFGQGTYDLSAIIPGVKFTGGVRYTEDENSQSTRNGAGICSDPATCGADTQVDNMAKSHAITWTAGLDYKVATDTLLYLTVNRGYRPGGFNGRSIGTGPPPPGYGPEFVQNLELGVKSDWRLGNIPIRTNADIWGQSYNDIQAQELLPGSINTITANVAKARLWGAELEALAQLTEDLQVGVNFDYVNFKYTHFEPFEQGTADLVTSETLNRPPYKYGVNGRYHLPLPSVVGNVSVRANWDWQSSNGDTAIPLGVAPAFGLLNMSADWTGVSGTPIDISLFASNVLNKVYVTQPVPDFEWADFGYGNRIYGEPRMYGIRLRYRFGAEGK
jgi:iron complex outermembrane recepter protein